MSKIVFNSGKELEFPYEKWNETLVKLKTGGIRMLAINDRDLGLVMVPLNSNNMEHIEQGPEPELQRREEEVAVDVEEKVEEEEIKEEPKEEKKETAQGKRDRLLEELKERSNCKHPPELLDLYRQETKTGTKYFNVCSFCGFRSRFIAKKDLEERGLDLDNAKEWIVK